MKAQFGALLILFAGSAHAELLVAKGARATLNVQYEYVAIGKKADKYEPREWQVNRTINFTTQMKADTQQPGSTLRPMEAAQMADLKNKEAHIASAQKKMQPTMNDMMKIADKCGDNEDCITKAVTEYGMNMEITPELASARQDIAVASKQGGPRYQVWQPVSQSGNYSVDELYRGQTADPLCLQKPKQRCNRQETRKGKGAISPPPGQANASTALLEVDSAKKEIYVTLPVPLTPISYSRAVVSDYPEEERGASEGVLVNLLREIKPLTATIPADLHAVSGTQSYKQKGVEGEGGTLTVKWQFSVL
jgi:hypothetical protein